MTGLTPGNFYSLRITATNSANFSTIGPIIRLQTLAPIPSTTNGHLPNPSFNSDNGKNSFEGGNAPGDGNGSGGAAIRLTPSKSKVIIPQAIVREASGGQSREKRACSDRQHSPGLGPSIALTEHTTSSNGGAQSDMGGSVEKLKLQLEQFRQEQHELEQHIKHETQESQSNLALLAAEKLSLERLLREKEESSSKLKRQGNALDKANRAAQSKRAAKEKILTQKKADRQRLLDDMAKWEEEIAEMERSNVIMREDMVTSEQTKNQSIIHVRQYAEEDQHSIRILEEEIRAKGIQIKELEDQRAKAHGETEEDREAVSAEKVKRQLWEAKSQEKQAQAQAMQQQIRQLEVENHRAQDQANWWLLKRTTPPQTFVSANGLEYGQTPHNAQQRRSRGNLSRGSTISVPSAGHLTGPTIPPMPSTFSMTPSWPYFDSGVSSPTDAAAMSHAITTPGAMSPRAGSLLPSNLFRDEDHYGRHNSGGHDSQGSQGSDGFTRRPADITTDGIRAPPTPASTSSRGGSLLGSPRDSISNLPRYSTPGDFPYEADRSSVHSSNAPYQQPRHAEDAPFAASKFSSLFSSSRFGRQRGKSANDEPPMLGTLKQGESQSFPHELSTDLMGPLDQSVSARRRGSYGNWTNSILGRTSFSQDDPKRGRIGVFGVKLDEADDQEPSSRPSSLYSLEQAMNRPSSESRRFPFLGHDNAANRVSPLGNHWGSGGIWSRGQSRRPSTQHGSTSNLSLGSTPLDLQPDELRKSLTDQAPIGTRPKPSKAPSASKAAAKLNPAAPAFRTIFNKKPKGADKGVDPSSESTKSITSHSEADENDPTTTSDFSPKARRNSRDTQSMIDSTTSQADSRSSLDHSISGTPSEGLTPSTPKETLMQRITRKGSSSKFNIPWNKDSRSASFFSSKKANGTVGDPVTPSEDDIESQEGNDNVAGTPHLEKLQEKGSKGKSSWPGLRRKSKKSAQSIFSGIETEEIEV